MDNLETPAVPDLPSDDFVLTPLVNAQAVMSEKARGKQKEASSYGEYLRNLVVVDGKLSF